MKGFFHVDGNLFSLHSGMKLRKRQDDCLLLVFRLVCLKCGHVFGQSCIEKWIRTEKNAKCPQCKARARIGDIRRIFARTIRVCFSFFFSDDRLR